MYRCGGHIDTLHESVNMSAAFAHRSANSSTESRNSTGVDNNGFIYNAFVNSATETGVCYVDINKILSKWNIPLPLTDFLW